MPQVNREGRVDMLIGSLIGNECSCFVGVGISVLTLWCHCVRQGVFLVLEYQLEIHLAQSHPSQRLSQEMEADAAMKGKKQRTC